MAAVSGATIGVMLAWMTAAMVWSDGVRADVSMGGTDDRSAGQRDEVRRSTTERLSQVGAQSSVADHPPNDGDGNAEDSCSFLVADARIRLAWIAHRGRHDGRLGEAIPPDRHYDSRACGEKPLHGKVLVTPRSRNSPSRAIGMLPPEDVYLNV